MTAADLEAPLSEAVRVGRARLLVAAICFAFGFAAVGARLVQLTLLKTGGEPALASAGAASAPPVERANIVDRNGALLASNLTTASLYADARVVLDPEGAAAKLVRALPELSHAEVLGKLKSGRPFVWIKRNLAPRQQNEINALGIPGLAFQEEQRRVYPQGALAAHVLGYTDVDGNGIAGVERFFDDDLKDRPRRGEDLRLSLDMRVQHAVRDELQATVARFSAEGAGALVLDVRTGEVLALVSLPDFDPNHAGGAGPLELFNRVTLGVYEMGSTFKAFTIASALHYGTSDLSDSFDATEPIRVGRYQIRDDHAKSRWLTLPEIFMYSSNIGAAKIALEVGTERQRLFLQRLGLLGKPDVELPEVGTPMVPSPWREINTMTIAFGHGLAVSPLQTAAGFAPLVNGGIRVPSTLIKRPQGELVLGERVVSPQTADTMRRLMRLVVEEGTGKQAAVRGFLVGGKTGTAEKAAAGGYARKSLLSSFVAAFPMTDPRYLVIAILDEPKGTKATYNFATGGWTAAPVTAHVIARAAPLLGVMPVDELSADVQKAMLISARKGRSHAAF
jgi:cell division protein FtsI (penicillin-binding protein 3)